MVIRGFPTCPYIDSFRSIHYLAQQYLCSIRKFLETPLLPGNG
jgi:hypothetical protein